MLHKLRNRKQEGFTIIEVLIVLAIAGLIILIVLLAVPALQRNGRNTTLKSDVGALAGGVSEFASNNDGGTPNTANSNNTTAGQVSLNNASGVAVIAKTQGATGVTFGAATVAAYTPSAGSIYMDFGAKCPTTVSGTTVTPVASQRSTAIIYATETSSSTLQARCTDS